MAKLSVMAVVQPSSSSADVIAGGVMEHPAVAATHALLEAIEKPTDQVRGRLRRWRAEATAVLADVLRNDAARAERVVEDLISGQRVDDLEQESIAELWEILDANIELARAHY